MNVFFIGIKGVGMTSIATLYKEWGHDVSGSDTDERFFTDEILKNLGITVVSFADSHVTADIDRVIYSSAYSKDHPQIVRAGELGIPVVNYGESLAEVFNARKGILVTGTHGKTTTTAMIARVLEDAGFDPTVVCGGEILEWSRTARAGKALTTGGWMVSEGDEYQAKMLLLKPHILFLTNIEFDHPDYYPDEAAYIETFQKLISTIPPDGFIVAHESVRSLVEKYSHTKIFFYKEDPHLTLQAWGAHNRTNASGVLVLAGELGIERELPRKTLANFRGTRRRMELYSGEEDSCVVMDDYAHHPTEIRATLSALREHYPTRHIIAVFQPHTYSRTKAFLNEFADAFTDADDVVLLDIYGSAREQSSLTGGHDLYQKLKEIKPQALFAENIEEGVRRLAGLMNENAVVVTMGAGDVWQIARRLLMKEEGQK
jgi:UDP-N-acetylmuramate--alanine ligase